MKKYSCELSKAFDQEVEEYDPTEDEELELEEKEAVMPELEDEEKDKE